jgi:hypothetical protein
MKNEFIPYELALKLKQLGFDKPCFGYYQSTRLIIQLPILKSETQVQLYMLDTDCNAPLFQQAFRWFRNLGFFVIFSTHDYNINDFYIKWSMPDSATISESILSDAYDTYEETELACLEKLIEILERKGAYVTSDRKK